MSPTMVIENISFQEIEKKSLVLIIFKEISNYGNE